MIQIHKQALWISLSVVAAATAVVLIPGANVLATQPKPEGKAACADLTGELTGLLDAVTAALVPPVTIPPALPDVTKATGIVGKVTNLATNLVNLGCLPDPASAVALPAVQSKTGARLPIPGLPIPTASVVPGLPLPTASVVPGLPGTPAVPPCAAPAAGLLSQAFGLLQTLLQLLGGSGVPDPTSALSQVTGLQSTLTDLTASAGGAPSCLPVPVPVKR